MTRLMAREPGSQILIRWLPARCGMTSPVAAWRPASHAQPSRWRGYNFRRVRRMVQTMATQKTPGRKPGTKMTAAHKAALAEGRDEARAVKAYLEGIEAAAPKKRGRKRTRDSMNKRLAAIAIALPEASALSRLQLLQEKSDLDRELASHDSASTADLEAARKGFVKVAKSYAGRKGITYSTWRAAGVDSATLKEAGITRGS